MTTRHVVESPIEVMLLAELYRRAELLEVGTAEGDKGPSLALATQVEVETDSGTYRIDIAVEALGARVGVECDGAEFHAAAEQVASDHARDQALRRAGWIIVRFTGSEIYRDAAGCADEIRRCLWFMAGRPKLRRAADGATREVLFADLSSVLQEVA